MLISPLSIATLKEKPTKLQRSQSRKETPKSVHQLSIDAGRESAMRVPEGVGEGLSIERLFNLELLTNAQKYARNTATTEVDPEEELQKEYYSGRKTTLRYPTKEDIDELQTKVKKNMSLLKLQQ